MNSESEKAGGGKPIGRRCEMGTGPFEAHDCEGCKLRGLLLISLLIYFKHDLVSLRFVETEL